MKSITAWVVSLCVGIVFVLGSFFWLNSTLLLSGLVGFIWFLLIHLAFHSRTSAWQSRNDPTARSSILSGGFIGLAMFTSFVIGRSLGLAEERGLMVGFLVLGAMSASFYIGVILQSMRTEERNSDFHSSEDITQSD